MINSVKSLKEFQSVTISHAPGFNKKFQAVLKRAFLGTTVGFGTTPALALKDAIKNYKAGQFFRTGDVHDR